MEILEKVAYMKGLAEGLGLDTKTKEGKILTVMIDILDDIALELQDLQECQMELEEGLDAVSDDLNDVETYIYEMDGEYDEDDEDEDDDDEDEDEVYETTCPNCEEVFYKRFTHLPLYGLSKEQVEYMADAVLEAVAEMQAGK